MEEKLNKEHIEKIILSQIEDGDISGTIPINDKRIVGIVRNCLEANNYNTDEHDFEGQTYVTYSKLNTSELRY